MRKHCWRSLMPVFGFVLCGTLVLGGAEKTLPSSDGKAAAAADKSSAAASVVDKDHQICFQCGGRGTHVCSAPGCLSGKIDCPAPCLKMSQGPWIHMTVAGHGPDELWRKFEYPGGWQAWNQHHLGEVIEMKDGKAVNVGKCKVCGGTTKVSCPTCKGTGEVACELCGGKKVIPVAWTATDNPLINRQTDRILLKDGRVILGKVVIRGRTSITIRTHDGKFMYLTPDDLAPQPPEAGTK